MSKITISIPQGTRDFDALTIQKRQYILHTIRHVYELYGYTPLETPSMENLDTLLGKYGDEGDKLIFKILNNGLHDAKNIDKTKAAFDQILQGKNDKTLTERALRYDLTIPFARYVAMHHTTLTMPYKRYQIQPVWRADRPQKGRYREFYQCDADVVGSNSIYNEAECISMYQQVFSTLGIPVTIKLNNRALLAALAALCGHASLLMPITIAIDKLDKIGIEKVKEELISKGIPLNAIPIIKKYINISMLDASNNEKLNALLTLLGSTVSHTITELRTLLSLIPTVPHAQVVIDTTLARGLNYYTGCILEVVANTVAMGSIGGGGRYNDLTGTFGVPNIPGMGISFGVDRIYDVLEELQLFPHNTVKGSTVLFLHNGIKEIAQAYTLLQQLRNQGIAGELYYEPAKVDKQYKYAEAKGIQYVVSITTLDLEAHSCTLKHLASRTVHQLSQAALLRFNF